VVAGVAARSRDLDFGLVTVGRGVDHQGAHVAADVEHQVVVRRLGRETGLASGQMKPLCGTPR